MVTSKVIPTKLCAIKGALSGKVYQVMAMQISKVRAEAPKLVETYTQVGRMLTSKGIKAATDKAAVEVYIDHSGSTEMGRNKLYTRPLPEYDGLSEMARVNSLAFAGGLFFDDDGNVPTYLFDTGVTPLGDTGLGNYEHVIDQHRNYRFGGTSYMAVLRHVIEQAGFAGVDLGTNGLFTRPSVKATLEYPKYILVVTDGEPDYDNTRDIEQLLIKMSQLPIFVQFVGVGEHEFTFLEKVDKLKGGLIDNVGFFDAKNPKAATKQGFLELMLSEFASSYYPGARKLGLVTSKA